VGKYDFCLANVSWKNGDEIEKIKFILYRAAAEAAAEALHSSDK
jgi:hypothetical protein